MKKVLVILVALCFVSAAQADVAVTVDPGATWLGYMNVFNTPADGGGYLWGSAWGTDALRATFAAGPATPLTLQANTNTYDDTPLDPYWVNQTTGEGNKVLEASMYQELGAGLGGQTITFDYSVVANDLAAAGYTTTGFIKALDPGAGWSVAQIVSSDLATIGAESLSLVIDANPALVIQAGFIVMGLNVSGTSPEAALGVTIVPEPMTIGLLGLGGLFLRRRK